MWVLVMFIFGSTVPTLTMHDFDDRAACQNAERLTNSSTAANNVRAVVYCVERGHSVFGPHDDAATLTQP